MPACKGHDTAPQKSPSGACLSFSSQLSLELVLIQQRTKPNKQKLHLRRGKELNSPGAVIFHSTGELTKKLFTLNSSVGLSVSTSVVIILQTYLLPMKQE